MQFFISNICAKKFLAGCDITQIKMYRLCCKVSDQIKLLYTLELTVLLSKRLNKVTDFENQF